MITVAMLTSATRTAPAERAGEAIAQRRLLAARQGAGQLADRLLMLLVLDLAEVAGDLEQHALVWRGRARLLSPRPS